MQMITKGYLVFSFSELSDTAKEKAVEKTREAYLDYDWYDYVCEDAKEVGKIIGIEIREIYFSAFHSQGDSACIEGRYSYIPESEKKIKELAPKDEKLQRIARRLDNIHKNDDVMLSATIKHSGHYYHSGCTEIEVTDNAEDEGEARREDRDNLKITLRDFMDWVYSNLRNDYDYLTSYGHLSEYLEDSDRQFLEDGTEFFG